MIDLAELSNSDWIWFMACAMLVGMDKAGVRGVAMLMVPIMAVIFGGKASAGLVLPLLSLADLFAVRYYNRHAEWKYVWRLLPAAVTGVLIAIAVGYYINDETFKGLIAVIIVGSLFLMLIQERGGLPAGWTDTWTFGSIFGLLGGFSTMIGNAAGPIMAVYLLAMRMPKNSFIGTGAWFFLIINLLKFPFHIFVWETITWSSFKLDLLAIPAIAIGIVIGIRIVNLIPEREFRYFIIVTTFLAALRLFF
jgi:uncharacterized membrane protein YfcA